MLQRLAAFAIVLSITIDADAIEGPLGRKVEDFQLQAFRGTKHALTEYRDSNSSRWLVSGTSALWRSATARDWCSWRSPTNREV